MTLLDCGWCTDTSEHIRCNVHGPDAPYVPPVTILGEALEPIRLRLPFTVPPVTANEARSGHWGGQAREKKRVAQAVMAVVRQARVPALERIEFELIWYAPDFGTRDPDGLGVMGKAVLDALTPPRPAIPKGAPTAAGTPRKKPQAAKIGVGIIPDDNAQYVESVTYRILLGQADPRIEMVLRPLPGMPPPSPARTARRSVRAGAGSRSAPPAARPLRRPRSR